jgi:hypothetical protein
MQAPITLAQAICAAILCLYAVGTSRGGDLVSPGHDQEYEEAIARAEILYRAAQDVCEKEQGGEREVCFKEAKATHIRALSEAKGRLKPAQMVADRRSDASAVREEGAR